MKISNAILIFACLVLGYASPLLAQQKGQWVPGQFGFNAGMIPDPGVTYANLALNYSASQLNGPNGNSIPGVVDIADSKAAVCKAVGVSTHAIGAKPLPGKWPGSES